MHPTSRLPDWKPGQFLAAVATKSPRTQRPAIEEAGSIRQPNQQLCRPETPPCVRRLSSSVDLPRVNLAPPKVSDNTLRILVSVVLLITASLAYGQAMPRGFVFAGKTDARYSAGFLSGGEIAQSGSRRWSAAAAQIWFSKQAWPLGFNYIPSTAINTTEMWQKETFDPATIEREMSAARKVGFNTARVFLQYLVWEDDPAGLKARMRTLMAIGARNHIRIIWVFFDDCTFSTVTDPHLGKQPDVIRGEYANGWTPSPGEARVLDRSAWPNLKNYVTDLISTFRLDQRILAWDLYNEPGNSKMENKSLPLLKAVFGWARSTNPSQPVTAGIWNRKLIDIERVILENSDIVTFHNYGNSAAMTEEINDLSRQGRPMICTEWLARQTGSTVANILPILHDRQVGGIIWGLVNGKMQTNYHWGSRAGSPAPALWQHDIFRPDMSYYDPAEIALFQRYAGLEQ